MLERQPRALDANGRQQYELLGPCPFRGSQEIHVRLMINGPGIRRYAATRSETGNCRINFETVQYLCGLSGVGQLDNTARYIR